MATRGGRREGAGRKHGSLNKNNQELRDMILQALNNQDGGGVGYLQKQAQDNPSAFMTLLGKVLPTQVTGEGGGPVKIAKIELVALESTSKDT